MADLYKLVSGTGDPRSVALLKRMFFETPWLEESLPSLVYEDQQGRILGCLGIMARRMKFHGRDVRAAVGHHFVVDSSRKGTLAGVELARQFLRGPQDLTLAEGDASSRRLWEFLGGSVGRLYSFCWTRPLRPVQYALTLVKRRGWPAAAALTLRPLGEAVDASLHFAPHRVFQFGRRKALADELDAVTLLAFLSAFVNDRALQPVYDISSLMWIVQQLDEEPHRGALHKVAVRTPSGRALGWYLYYLGATGLAEVLQVGGTEDTIGEVLDHLFYHAWQRGAVAASGQADPRMAAALSANHCVFQQPQDSWMLVHSRDQRIINAIHAGDAFLTRLEGDPWMTPRTSGLA